MSLFTSAEDDMPKQRVLVAAAIAVLAAACAASPDAQAPQPDVGLLGVQTMSFLSLCKPNAVELLAETKEELVCQETHGRTRDDPRGDAPGH